MVAIQFSGLLSDSNIEKHTKVLSKWVKDKGFSSSGKVVSAGYNGPFTLPMFRRNEVLMEITLQRNIKLNLTKLSLLILCYKLTNPIF